MTDLNNISQYADRINLSNKKYNKEISVFKKKLENEASRIARELYDASLGIEKIWGFGSVFEDKKIITPESDIDLAIEGGDYFSALKISGRSMYKVDLLDISGKNDYFSDAVRKYGVYILPK